MKELRVDQNKDIKIHPNSLENIASLEIFDFSNGGYFPEEFFLEWTKRPETKLKQFKLKNTKIFKSSIQDNFYLNNSKINKNNNEGLNLKNNPWTFCSINMELLEIGNIGIGYELNLRGCKKLKWLHADNNKFDRLIFGESSGPEKLLSVSLNSNLFKEWAESLLDVSHSLITLNLANNLINYLPENGKLLMTLFPCLEQLDLSGNKLNRFELESSLTNIPTKLAYLNLSNNQLQKFGSSIKEELPSIEVLDLSNNQLKIFNLFEWLPSLTFLYLNQNKGINIQINKRKTNFKLIFLQLNNCLLEEMPDFSKFLALKSLELCGNKLTEVPGYLLPITRFLEYDFRNNSLNKLGWDWSETQIERISELKVDVNSLDCACPMPERLIKIVGELEKPKGYICVPKLNSSTIYHWQHPLEALDFIQTTSINFPQNCPSIFSSKIKTETNNSINFSLFLLPILLITVPLIIGILMLLNISNWNDLHWVKTTTKSSMFAYEPLQIKNGNEENNVDNV